MCNVNLTLAYINKNIMRGKNVGTAAIMRSLISLCIAMSKEQRHSAAKVRSIIANLTTALFCCGFYLHLLFLAFRILILLLKTYRVYNTLKC